MNAKKVKNMRRTLRKNGVAVGGVEYRINSAGTITMDWHCGRAVYKRVKKLSRQTPRPSL